MTGGREAAHVGADLGDDHLGGEVTDAGDGPQQPDRVTERVEIALHLRVDPGQRRRERVVLAEVQAQQEAVALGDAGRLQRGRSAANSCTSTTQGNA